MDMSTASLPAGFPVEATPKLSGHADDARLREVAKEFESVFIGEMLKNMGLDEATRSLGGGFDGGYGEDAFRTFLVREYAQALSDKNAFGLADKIYSQLKAQQAAAAAVGS